VSGRPLRRQTLLSAACEVLKLAGRPMGEDALLEAAKRRALVRHGTAESLRSAVYHDLRAPDGRLLRLPGGLGLREWRYHPDPELQRQAETSELDRTVRQWLRAVRLVTRNFITPPAADVLLVWAELCFRLDLPQEGSALFDRVVADEADPWLLARVRRLNRLMRQQLVQREDGE
jgi:hypothetical protein